jgi:hypothetical protein
LWAGCHEWDQEISKELEASSVCIIALTRESLDSKWIMFEAGAISKSPGKPRLCTVLFGIEPTDVEGPLERFQGTKFSKEEICQLLKTINSNAREEEALSETTLNKVFEMWWPKLEEDVNKTIKEAGSSTTEVRDQRDLLQEVLGLTRVMAEQQSQIREMLVGIFQVAVFNPNLLAMVKALRPVGVAPASADLKLDPSPSLSILTSKSE